MKNTIVCLMLLSAFACSQKTSTHDRDPASESMMSMSMAVTTEQCISSTGSLTPRVSEAQQNVINQTMGTHEHRLMHALWHAVRGGLNNKQSTDIAAAFGPTWSQSHAICPAPQNNAASGQYNPAGEDFLYMHREMVGHLRSALIAAKLPCIAGFDHVPGTNDYPMPDSVRTGAKSDAALAKLQDWDLNYFTNANWLKTKSLSQVGWALELSLHNNLHMRFATDVPPAGFSGVAKTGGAPVPFNNHFTPNWKYDGPGYNWLADPYGAAVNPTFWKIHGYVDHVIDLWLEANGYQKVALDCQHANGCYQWKGSWVGEIDMPRGGGNGTLGAGNPNAVDPNLVKLNQKRMRSQWLGVITEAELHTYGAPRSGAPTNDPFDVTVAKICTNQP